MASYFVAGASRGIGLELARQLAAKESTSIIFAGARKPASLETARSEFSKLKPLQLDVNSEHDTKDAIDTISKTTGGKLDVLICNAGINLGDDVAHASTEELRLTLETNTIAVHRIIQATLPLLRAGKAKKIVIIGAATGTHAVAHHMASQGLPAVGSYAVSKAATHMLVMLYGAELAKEGILTASVHPGIVTTDMSGAVMEKHPEMRELVKSGGFKVISPAESVEGILKVVDGLSSETSGKVIDFGGDVMPF